MRDSIRRVQVWGGVQRLLHWALALCVLALLASGWLAGWRDLPFRAQASGAHANTGYVLALLLLVRAYLLFFGTRAEHWRDCVPGKVQRGAVADMLRFYLTGTRSLLPAYYAHNPLWGPVYLLLYLLLALQAISGILGLQEWHLLGFRLIAGLALLHLVAVFLHDWKGTGSEVSAMISGYKIFVVSRQGLEGLDGPPSVSVDALRRGPR
jgi:Ni/Fe-hydrogenase 1 B-type cytochrome subunit